MNRRKNAREDCASVQINTATGGSNATLNMNKPVGDLTIDDDSDVCTLANELRLIGAPKKKEKGKGNEAMLGVKEKKKKREQLLGRWRGGGSQLVRQQVH